MNESLQNRSGFGRLIDLNRQGCSGRGPKRSARVLKDNNNTLSPAAIYVIVIGMSKSNQIAERGKKYDL